MYLLLILLSNQIPIVPIRDRIKFIVLSLQIYLLLILFFN